MKQLDDGRYLIDFYLAGRGSRRVRRRVTGTEREALREEGRLRAIASLDANGRKCKYRSAKDFRWLTTSEFASILNQCNELERASLDVLLLTGLRVSDFVALDESMLRGGVLVVPVQKTGRILHQRCPDELAALVREIAGRWQYERAKRFVRSVTKRAGLKPCGPHVLRHTCASWMVQADVPIYRVKTHLGHSTLQSTQRYAHLSSTIEWRDAEKLLPEQTRVLIDRTWLRKKPAKSILFAVDKVRKVV